MYRYSFDIPNLADGIDFVVVVIGLFAVAEMLQMLENLLGGVSIEVPKSKRKLFNLKELGMTWWSTVRGGVMGFFYWYLAWCRGQCGLRCSLCQREKNISKAKTPMPCLARVTCAVWLHQKRPITVPQPALLFPC